MDKNVSIKFLLDNFHKWCSDHLENLRFLVSELYKVFDLIITISVAVIGIIIPLILNSKIVVKQNLLFISVTFFMLEILIGIYWRFYIIKKAERKWPKILQDESENLKKTIEEIKLDNNGNHLAIVEKNFDNRNKKIYSIGFFEISFMSIFAFAILFFILSLYQNFFYFPRPEVNLNSVDKSEQCGDKKFIDIKTLPVFGNFEKYQIKENYTQKPISLDLESSYITKRFKTRLNWAINDGVNFAGHYVIGSWGMTGIGYMLIVVDATNGKAYPFPFIAQTGFEFRKDSNLLIIDPVSEFKKLYDNNPENLCYAYLESVRPYYFIWENNQFTLLGPKDNPPPNSNDNGWMSP